MNAVTTYCTALVLVCVSFASSAQDAVLSPQYATCMDKSGGVTMGMIGCIAAETSRQDARLNKAYKTAMAALSPCEVRIGAFKCSFGSACIEVV